MIISRFGIERVIWGSDWTRIVDRSYSDSVGYLLDLPTLSEADKASLMGVNLRRIYNWQ
jgi:L-fuconolactonase